MTDPIYTDALTRLKNVLDSGSFAVHYNADQGHWHVTIDDAFASSSHGDLDHAVDEAVDWLAGGRKNVVIAECIVESGYGTSYFDPDTGECDHENYATVNEVISNHSYWSRYDSMSNALARDFELGFNFDRYRLTVMSNGDKAAENIDRKKYKK